MNDVVFIKGLKINTLIGVYDWERAIKQSLVIDARLECDMSKASSTDDVAHAINYKTVCEDIERLCHELKAKLLESLAQNICDYLLANYPCLRVTLTIHKPNAIKAADSVGVEVVREKQ
ncbi:dihydroneopterin aldolase [Moraxella caviae]|uniref:7,8-dihydroneopterin aldolase n=1 Tax=Moraxella caviae TaxID=34060 RepID=A0A1S9ZZS9_9GAMM|nr:dihydroneopterin aldolase [Moraxella caviae]OOR89000.1 dihydroneopterin aldolase [Moraxella caviae]STZ14754.1 Dihydroneopterin aldolase [Moraxella caviae]VEW13995.1 Dihydroneopterin aldolase [Moraxella caviae]